MWSCLKKIDMTISLSRMLCNLFYFNFVLFLLLSYSSVFFVSLFFCKIIFVQKVTGMWVNDIILNEDERIATFAKSRVVNHRSALRFQCLGNVSLRCGHFNIHRHEKPQDCLHVCMDYYFILILWSYFAHSAGLSTT